MCGVSSYHIGLYRESLTYKSDTVLILKFRILDMVLGSFDVVQCLQNLGYCTIIFVYGARDTSLCPLGTTKVLQMESLSCYQDMMVFLSLSH